MTPTEASWSATSGTAPAPSITLRLARLCGVSRRDIEEAVETLRLDGEPIVAGPYGLRLTDDPEELSAYVKGRRDRARSILRASRPLRATVDRLRQRDLTLGLG
jgi:hypothetical protein